MTVSQYPGVSFKFQGGNFFVGTQTPVGTVGDLWSDTTSGSVLKQCTAAPSTWEAIEGGAGSFTNLSASGTMTLSGVISPTQLSANTDNWAPTGLSGAAVIRVSTDASRNLTGITGGASGRVLLLYNVGAQNLVLIDDATSTAANRFQLNSDYTLLPNTAVLLQYDATDSRWRAVGAIAASSETQRGIVELSTDAEAVTGTDTVRAVTPANLTARLAAPGAIGGTTKSTNVGTEAVSFPATQVASADPNTLDDYEEGTWTPVITFATPGDLSVTYSTQTGTYTKIGNRVMIDFTLATSAFTHTTAAGALLITGLPFTPDAVTARVGALRVRGITDATRTMWVTATDAGSTRLTVQGCGSAAAPASVTATEMPTGGTVSLQGSVVYKI